MSSNRLILTLFFLSIALNSFCQKQETRHRSSRIQNQTTPHFIPGKRVTKSCKLIEGAWVLQETPARLPQGDSSYAYLACCHTSNNDEVKARLDYIDTTVATLVEFWDNIELGLKVNRPNYRVVKFTIGYICNNPHRDLIGFCVNGDKIPKRSLALLDVYEMKSGDAICFYDIRMQRTNQSFTVPLKNVQIKIR